MPLLICDASCFLLLVTCHSSLFFRHSSLVTCHWSRSLPSHPAPLRWSAPVMWYGCDVLDVANLQPCGRQRANGRFPARARPLHSHFYASHPVITRGVGHTQRSLLGCEGCPLARTLEAQRTRAGPADQLPVRVGDAHKSIVEGRLNVNDARRDDPLFLLFEDLFLACFCCRFHHETSSVDESMSQSESLIH